MDKDYYPTKYDKDLEMEFADNEIALDYDYDIDRPAARPSRFNVHFQEEFKAAFEEDVPEEPEFDPKSFETVKEEGFTAGIYELIRCVIFAIVIVALCLTFVFRLVEVDGHSMDDTLSDHDRVFVTNLMYTPQNNDIIVISHGEKYDKPIIKRVIATEGQTVRLDYQNERIIVDGVVLNEPYIKGTTFSGNTGDNEIPEVIPKGKLFVMGDNRHISMDSRSTQIGLIDVDNVIGKAQFVAFPFDHLGYLY